MTNNYEVNPFIHRRTVSGTAPAGTIVRKFGKANKRTGVRPMIYYVVNNDSTITRRAYKNVPTQFRVPKKKKKKKKKRKPPAIPKTRPPARPTAARKLVTTTKNKNGKTLYWRYKPSGGRAQISKIKYDALRKK